MSSSSTLKLMHFEGITFVCDIQYQHQYQYLPMYLTHYDLTNP